MTVNVVIFHNENCFGKKTLTQMPQKGDHVHLENQPVVGYRVKEIIILQEGYEELDAIVLIDGFGALKPELFHSFLNAERERTKWRERMNKRAEEYRLIRKNRFKNPDKVWQRYKNIYERIENGETVKEVAADMNLSPSRISELKNLWKTLIESQKDPND